MTICITFIAQKSTNNTTRAISLPLFFSTPFKHTSWVTQADITGLFIISTHYKTGNGFSAHLYLSLHTLHLWKLRTDNVWQLCPKNKWWIYSTNLVKLSWINSGVIINFKPDQLVIFTCAWFLRGVPGKKPFLCLTSWPCNRLLKFRSAIICVPPSFFKTMFKQTLSRYASAASSYNTK